MYHLTILYVLITMLFLMQPDGNSFAYGLGAPGVGSWAGMAFQNLTHTISILLHCSTKSSLEHIPRVHCMTYSRVYIMLIINALASSL